MSTSFQNWLIQVTLPYVYSSQVCNEVDLTLRQFHNLRPQSSQYTLSDGSQASLLNLIGSVPVISQQNQCRVIEVPVEICLPLHFPLELPIIWIRPDLLGGELKGTVVIRQTDNVDGNGMVWGIEGLRGLRLVEIIVNLQSIFGYQLPIVSAVIANTQVQQVQEQEEQQEYLGGAGTGYRERSRSPIESTMINSEIVNRTFVSGNSTFVNNNSIAGNNITYSANSTTNNHPINQINNDSNRDKLKRKVVSEIESKLKDFEGENDKLNEMKTKLFEGENILNREKMTLNNEINLLNKEIDLLELKRTEIERFISNNSGEISQRSATTPSDPGSSQLLELLANESALMDALYQLIKVTVTPVNGENRVPLGTALRCIRELSRKHFLTKAHIRKIIN